ncbi:uncharacterized protein CCR75_004659 [Bremia lactucae]|uniref:Uncharacterized protein n=1 Tax=Bremia lactucae TaxID=4779 RepID=A0A976IG34_BRELC|nr:hypothetical protein CCR75_004659 [Bremia lactucae]
MPPRFFKDGTQVIFKRIFINMVLTTDRDITVKKEFSSLALVLEHTADDAVQCLKMLKKSLAEYDFRHGHKFLSSAKSYMKSDIRYAKDISSDLKHVAQQINKSKNHSKSEVELAQSSMNATANAMNVLKTRSRIYDETDGRATGVKGMIQNIVGGANKGIDKVVYTDNQIDLDGENGSSDTVESLVEITLQNSFDLNVLKHQISTAENSLIPSIVERAQEAVHEAEETLKCDMTTPTPERMKKKGQMKRLFVAQQTGKNVQMGWVTLQWLLEAHGWKVLSLTILIYVARQRYNEVVSRRHHDQTLAAANDPVRVAVLHRQVARVRHKQQDVHTQTTYQSIQKCKK